MLFPLPRAQTGLAGDSASGGDSRANYPVLFAELYDPDKPLGDRIRRLAPTKIARMYHSTGERCAHGGAAHSNKGCYLLSAAQRKLSIYMPWEIVGKK